MSDQARWVTRLGKMHMPTDQIVGRNIALLRRVRGMSQTDLADEMSGLGLRWHQQTVLKVEKGQRTLRFDEAYAVARLLKVDLADLIRIPDVLKPTEQLRKAVEIFEVVLLETDRQIRRALSAQEDLQKQLDSALDKWGMGDDLSDALPEGRLAQRARELLRWSPKYAAEQAEQRMAQQKERMHITDEDGVAYEVEVDEPDVPATVQRERDEGALHGLDR